MSSLAVSLWWMGWIVLMVKGRESFYLKAFGKFDQWFQSIPLKNKIPSNLLFCPFPLEVRRKNIVDHFIYQLTGIVFERNRILPR